MPHYDVFFTQLAHGLPGIDAPPLRGLFALTTNKYVREDPGFSLRYGALGLGLLTGATVTSGLLCGLNTLGALRETNRLTDFFASANQAQRTAGLGDALIQFEQQGESRMTDAMVAMIEDFSPGNALIALIHGLILMHRGAMSAAQTKLQLASLRFENSRLTLCGVDVTGKGYALLAAARCASDRAAKAGLSCQAFTEFRAWIQQLVKQGSLLQRLEIMPTKVRDNIRLAVVCCLAAVACPNAAEAELFWKHALEILLKLPNPQPDWVRAVLEYRQFVLGQGQ
jgi:hypothetical protein